MAPRSQRHPTRDRLEAGQSGRRWAGRAAHAANRVGREFGITADLPVVLTNQALVAGRGWVKFGPKRVHGATATLDQLALTLPKDGAWVSFIIAGSYGHPSKRDKDAVIAVHHETSSGMVLGTQALMVHIFS